MIRGVRAWVLVEESIEYVRYLLFSCSRMESLVLVITRMCAMAPISPFPFHRRMTHVYEAIASVKRCVCTVA